jgi:O-antigen/teichoic acid export membrane protein
LFALTNFVVSLLLARWLPAREYGGFAVAFSVLLLLGTVHTAVLTEPMLIFGPSRYRGRTASYLRLLTPLHFALTAALSAVVLFVVLILALTGTASGSGGALVGVAVSAPAILFLWLARRACYIDALPGLAAAAGLVYAVLVPTGMLLLTALGWLTAASALLTLGAASLLVGLGLRRRLTRSVGPAAEPLRSGEVARDHWTYGRWALASGLLSWVPGNIVVLALPLWHSLAEAGTLRVATTLIMPVQQVQAALATLLLPSLVRARESGRLRSTATTAQLVFAGSSLGYAPIVLLLGSALTGSLFGEQYRLSGTTLWLVAAIPFFTAVSLVSVAVLRAVERPDQVLLTSVGSTAVTFLIGLPLIWRWGVDGALASILLSAVAAAVLARWANLRVTAGTRTSAGRHGRRVTAGLKAAPGRSPSL